MSVTIRDVAREAGVSVATVSLVLNEAGDRLRIASQTQERVRACAQTLGYVPDQRARSLRRPQAKTSMLVAFLARRVPDAFFVDIMHALDEEAARGGRDTQFLLVQPDRPRAWETLRAAAKASAGVILVGSPEDGDDGEVLRGLSTPLVRIGSGVAAPGAVVVRVDNHLAGQGIAEHLLSLGHRAFAVLGPQRWFAPFVERRAGIVDALRAAAAPAPLVLATSAPDAETIAQLRRSGATAVVCLYDRLALRLLQQARLAGVEVPGHWSVAGFDDMEWSALLSPPLTTVHIPRRAMAALAVRRLEELLAGSLAQQTTTVAPQLVVRGSTGVPPAPDGR